MNLKRELETRIAGALAAAGAPEGAPALVVQAARPEFGHYQANGVMAAAKRLKTNPRDLARKVVAALDISDVAEEPEIAGPGFINIRLKPEFLATRLAEALNDQHLGIDNPEGPQTVVVDFSSPNLAKEMHVGHLRSTIIGDALARVLHFVGHEVIRQNHVGDWGTQFGMLIAQCKRDGVRVAPVQVEPGTSGVFVDGAKITDMEELYKRANVAFDTDPAFADQARDYVVKLQKGEKGDADVKALWDWVKDQSLEHAEDVYERLGVLLKRGDVRGESFYNKHLWDVIERLKKKNLLDESQGAKCVFLEEFKGKDGLPLPMIVQKSDGGYLYATTDLAAIRFRCGKGKADGVVDWTADRILYVTDARQLLHFRQLFAVARKAGFAGEDVSLEHVAFGTMLGKDNKPFRTREDDTVKLMDLLDEAERKALDLVTEKNPDLDDARKREIARIVGIGAVKYADLCRNRTSDYVFSWNKMLSLDGNTAPYMQYAYARVRSIFRKGDLQESAAAGKIVLNEPAELALGVGLAQFPETIAAVADDCLPNLLCGYLFDLAGAFMSFYEACPVLKADDATRASRLVLCLLTARTIRTGLGLLGIETLEQM